MSYSLSTCTESLGRGEDSSRSVAVAVQHQPANIALEHALGQAQPGLGYRTTPGATQGARATPVTRPDPGDGTGDTNGAGTISPTTEQE